LVGLPRCSLRHFSTNSAVKKFLTAEDAEGLAESAEKSRMPCKHKVLRTLAFCVTIYYIDPLPAEVCAPGPLGPRS
jgi:hypothetical protein